jgi:hypothetical protein
MYTEINMSRCSHLVVALSLIWAGATLAAEPSNSGGAAGSTSSAAGEGTEAVPVSTWVVAGVAAVGTAVGLSTGGSGGGDDGFTAPSTSTSTATATAN